MKSLTLTLTIAVILAAHFAISGFRGALHGLPLAPFYVGPLGVTAVLSFYSKRSISQSILLASTITYSLWLWFVYMSAMHWHPDAQSAIAFVFVGIYSLPVMIPLWITAWLKRKPLA
jgi:hypothetical protein